MIVFSHFCHSGNMLSNGKVMLVGNIEGMRHGDENSVGGE